MQSTKVKYQYELEMLGKITGTFFPCIFSLFQVAYHEHELPVQTGKKNHLKCLLMQSMPFYMFQSL